MPTAAEIASDEASVTIIIGDRPINVVYFPNKITTKALTLHDSGLDGMCKVLSEIVKSWDLLISPDDPSMYPLDANSLADLGYKFMGGVSKGILEDMRPN
jgi:hypothetical protein